MVEATAYLLKDCLLPVLEYGVSVSEVRSLGRAAASGFWLQVKADVLGVPVEQPVCPSAASVGAAMLAATGTGQFASLKEASLAWHKPARRFEPRASEVERYATYYQNYRASCELLYASGVGLGEDQE
jgi:xylulokinase